MCGTEMKVKSVVENLLFPLLVISLTPLALLVGSRIESGAWLDWTVAIPPVAYISFAVLIVVWITAATVAGRLRVLKQRNLPTLPTTFAIPMNGYTPVGQLEHNGVKWTIEVPAPGPLGWRRGVPDNVDIDTPPRCSACTTEIEETETFFGRFHWKCLSCGQSVKNKMSYHHEAVRAERLAQAWWERTGRNEIQEQLGRR